MLDRTHTIEGGSWSRYRRVAAGIRNRGGIFFPFPSMGQVLVVAMGNSSYEPKVGPIVRYCKVADVDLRSWVVEAEDCVAVLDYTNLPNTSGDRERRVDSRKEYSDLTPN